MVAYALWRRGIGEPSRPVHRRRSICTIMFLGPGDRLTISINRNQLIYYIDSILRYRTSSGIRHEEAGKSGPGRGAGRAQGGYSNEKKLLIGQRRSTLPSTAGKPQPSRRNGAGISACLITHSRPRTTPLVKMREGRARPKAGGTGHRSSTLLAAVR